MKSFFNTPKSYYERMCIPDNISQVAPDGTSSEDSSQYRYARHPSDLLPPIMETSEGDSGLVSGSSTECVDKNLASGQDNAPTVFEMVNTTGAGPLLPFRLPPLVAAGTSGKAPSLPHPAIGTPLPPGAHV